MNEVTIKYENNQMLVTSLQVSEDFGKQHRHVLESIRNLVAENSAAKLVFFESEYENRGKKYPMFTMNRDGFTLLAMGFTGKEALEWKFKYIEAFNNMEAKLNSPEFIMNRALEISRKQIEALMLENNELKPKGEYFDALVERNLLTNFRDTAKELHLKQKILMEYLYTNKFIYKDKKGNIKPYANFVDKGYFEIKEFANKNIAGVQTLVTPKGRESLRLLLNVNEEGSK